jgi:hypothetical protein
MWFGKPFALECVPCLTHPANESVGCVESLGAFIMSQRTYAASLLACQMEHHNDSLPHNSQLARFIRQVRSYAEMIGTGLSTTDGELVGWLEDVMLDQSGRPVTAIVACDPLGEDLREMPWEMLGLDQPKTRTVKPSVARQAALA